MDSVNLQIDSNITKDLDAIQQGQLSLFELGYNPDVLDCLSSLSNDEVFTSPKLANQMLDLLPSEIWSNPKATFLDPVCKSGVFLREIVKRLDKGLTNQIPDKQTRINHILKNQVFGIAITGLTALLSRRSVYCSKVANSPLSICEEFDNDMGNIIFGAVRHHFKDGKCSECGASQAVFGNRQGLENHAYAFIHSDRDDVFGELLTMKFDVIIGNPPYQLNVGVEKKNFAIPIYQKFVQQAIKLNPRYLIMITPSRWFAGGRGLDEFRNEMLKEKRFREIHDFPNASDVFTGVEIKGGVNFFLWESDYNGDCTVKSYENGIMISEMTRPLKEKGAETFIRDNNAIGIFHKVKKFNEQSFMDIASMQTPFGLVSSFKSYKKNPFEKSIKIYGNQYVGYIERSQVLTNHHWIDDYKVYLPSAIGSGDVSKDNYNPILGEKNSCCSQTYLLIGTFKTEQECLNVMSYIRTKFFRFMVSLKKNAQHSNRGVYEFVPMQDFSKSWTDSELYIKYGLSNQQINYIEKTVKTLDDVLNDEKPKKSRNKKSKQADLLENGDE